MSMIVAKMNFKKIDNAKNLIMTFLFESLPWSQPSAQVLDLYGLFSVSPSDSLPPRIHHPPAKLFKRLYVGVSLTGFSTSITTILI
jgi:hypothetical protein